jgi:NhaA family Na+:H+ antiporter
MKRYFKAAFVTPIDLFLKTEAKSGILLAICAMIAMILANSSWAPEYFHILGIKLFNLNLQQWVNDALMAIFFFVIGMEIKKEIVAGELRSPQRAALPVAAALGGMIFPALIYYSFNPRPPDLAGWGIPMATDIAFALGVLTLFGRRVPLSLKIFLLAIAIVDDLGAILVIAFFYTNQINGYGLGIAALFIGLMALVKAVGIRSYWIYTLLGATAWLGVLLSGVHATIAGVVIGLLTPLTFPREKDSLTTYSPLNDLVHALHPWVSYGIMPVFALANAGITLTGTELSELIINPIHRGVAIGLVFGKPAGIIFFSLLAEKTGLAKLPSDLNWKNIIAVGLLAGIGFTMSIFISNLALSSEQEIYSKTGIVAGSLASALLGSIFLALTTKKKHTEP